MEFSGIWLSAEILALDDLNLTEKVIASQVLMLSRQGECTAKNDYLALQLDLTKTTVSQTLKNLREKGYIVIEDGKDEGNKRQMYPSLKLLHTLCKNLTEGWQKSNKLSVKILQSLYKIFTEAIPESYTPYVKILQSLFKNLTELYIRTESKEESKIENKEEKKYTLSASVVPTSFWSVLNVPFSDYRKWLKAESKKIYVEWPTNWTPAMIENYKKDWLKYRQSMPGKKLKSKSIQTQIDELALLTAPQLKACINNSIAGGYQGIFPDKFKKLGVPPIANHSPAPTTNKPFRELT